ncbi:hypothetical protein MAPG_02654 [Magnaporthiopsis poae ATCC 64411]|uniref:Yeast cell wall synthesis Kre9/Knh1-like N-terminal domain-containing protein n=1 Tax=Magnaporthiopsis poae (strain ATCC 64411 / 73-15) TaxID=644358 RepID=A0A0C4DRY6_MAGP6|nr:hypothetical protein MAPG_02654 [Magnaporthiopsis poae ATCC 64411]
MQFTIAAILALAGSALAQTPGFNPLTNPTMNEVIPAGKPYTIKWTPQGGNGAPVSLYAYAGESASTLQEISTIATGVDASQGKFEWNINPAIGGKYKAYGIKIALTSDKETYQWSNPFTISAAEGSSSAASSSSSPATTTASTSSSAATSMTDNASVTTSKPVSSTTIPTTSSSVAITTHMGNLSTTAVVTGGATTQVTLVTSTSRASSAAAGSTTSPATVPTGAAVAKGASSIAVVAGLAMAVLAL